ncbi:hypothetical protein L9F63_009326, partial [Diploptera punctata]
MSGQWEVVGKNKQKQSGQSKKLTKGEKKKFVENAPKVEDILPLAQVKSLYTALDNNKENRKPQGKDNNAKENEAKKTQKKQQPEKKKEVKEKPQIPKSLEMAVKMIDVKDLASELSIGKVRFQEAPLVWLKGLAEYLNLKLDHTNPVAAHKSNEYPLCVLTGEIREILKQALKDAGETPVQHFYHICLSSMANDMSKGTPVYGYRVMLQLMAFQNPSITTSNIPKLQSLLNSYQNRQQIGLAILTAVGQGGVKDIQVGVKVWLEVMLPLLELRNYTSFVIGYLKDILVNSSENKQVSQEQFFALLDVIHSANNLPNNMKQELLALSPELRIRSLKTESEKHLRNYFDPLLQRLQPTASKTFKEELLTCLVSCLNSDQHCYSTWRQLYTKHLPQSALLLQHIDSQWSTIKEKVTVKKLRETVCTFRVTNEELRKGKHKDEVHLSSCQHSCE